MTRKNSIYIVVQVSLYLALLIISSFIAIPLPFSLATITLQTIIINVIALTFKPKYSLLIVGLYILMGIVGLPVFGGGTAGIAKIFSPVGGYYIGFLISAFIMSLFNKNLSFKKGIYITILIGMPIQHILAIFWMLFYNDFNIINSFLTISLPFILGDIIKCIISSLLITQLKKHELTTN